MHLALSPKNFTKLTIIGVNGFCDRLKGNKSAEKHQHCCLKAKKESCKFINVKKVIHTKIDLSWP